MDFIKIESQESFDEIMGIIKDNDDSFVKEAIYVSNSYLEDDAIVAPDSKGSFCILIAIPDNEPQYIELLFKEVENVQFSLKYECDPVGVVENNRVEFKLIDITNNPIIAEQVYYREVDHESGNLSYYS